MKHTEDYIKREDLKVGKRYRCDARNFEIGTWNGEAFEYMRTKFAMVYPDTELHWDDDPKYGTVKPLEELEDE